MSEPDSLQSLPPTTPATTMPEISTPSSPATSLSSPPQLFQVQVRTKDSRDLRKVLQSFLVDWKQEKRTSNTTAFSTIPSYDAPHTVVSEKYLWHTITITTTQRRWRNSRNLSSCFDGCDHQAGDDEPGCRVWWYYIWRVKARVEGLGLSGEEEEYEIDEEVGCGEEDERFEFDDIVDILTAVLEDSDTEEEE